MNITNNERIALNMLALNLYNPANGARPKSFSDVGDVWSNCLDSHTAPETLAGRTLSATIASLVKKGLATTYDAPVRSKDSTVGLTPEGFTIWMREFPAEPPAAAVTVTTAQGLKVDINFNSHCEFWSCTLHDEPLQAHSLETLMSMIADHIVRTEF